MADCQSTRAPACRKCGQAYTARDRAQAYCSRECQWSSMRTRPTLSCEGCGGGFIRRRRMTKDAQRYCSRACFFATNAKPTKPSPACIICGSEFKAHGRKRTCSDECATANREAVYARRARAHDRRDRSERKCGECSAVFAPEYGNKRRRFCSSACADRSSRRQSARRAGGKSDRKRARKAGVEYQPIDRAKLFVRDGWRCQVCGVKTPKRLRGKLTDRSPELDHRVPLAQGGGHTWQNVQLACRKCNGAKGGHRVAGQLPLFAVPATSQHAKASRPATMLR
jgi:5-methylcytosine-specific restriction endonuclease McrA